MLLFLTLLTKIHLFDKTFKTFIEFLSIDKNRSSKVKIIYQCIEVPSSSLKAVISNKKEDLLDEDKALKITFI